MFFATMPGGQKPTGTFFLVLGCLISFICLFWFAQGLTPAGRACRYARRGDLLSLRALLQKKPALARVTDTELEATPLHWAVMGGHTDVARLLLDAGADVNAVDKYGMTPLHRAAVLHRMDAIRLLLERKADTSAIVPKYGRIMVTPLDLAAECGYADVVALLLDYGALLHPPKPPEMDVTALHLAAGKGHLEVVRVLLEHGADPNARDMNGRTPLVWAGRMGFDDIEMVLRMNGAR